MKENKYRGTVVCCFFGYMCQAIICNFAPLLFLTFSSQYGIPMSEITLLVTANFGFQLLTDLVAPRYVDRVGYRASLVFAHICCALGLIGLTLLPSAMGGFAGLLVSTVIYAVGGGLLEVLVSPVLESLPMKNKSGAMSLLHSFYCWGSAATVIISTAFFGIFGISNWKILAIIFSVFPVLNALMFTRMPLLSPEPSEKSGFSAYKELLTNPVFLLFLVMMVCSGASEMAVQQWSSVLAESALGVDKAEGDLFGMCGFSIAMAISRTLYGRFSAAIPLRPALMLSSGLCIICYMMITLCPIAAISFIGCILCGFSVGVFWPGSFSLAASGTGRVSTLMFALLSLFGDVGCTLGPTVAGFVSNALGEDLKKGILSCIVFPMLLPICLCIIELISKKRNNVNNNSKIKD